MGFLYFIARIIPSNHHPLLHPSAMGGAPQGGAGYTFALPGNQAYNVLPGNLYLPAQNSGYTVTYQKSRRAEVEPTVTTVAPIPENEDEYVEPSLRRAPRPGGYAFTLPANQNIVVNPGNLQLPGNAEGY